MVGNRNDVLSVIDVRMHKVVCEKPFEYEVNEIAFDKSGKMLFAGALSDNPVNDLLILFLSAF